MKTPVTGRLEQAGVVETIGAARFFPTVRSAVAACAGIRAVCHAEGPVGQAAVLRGDFIPSV